MATRWEQITELFKQAAQEVTANPSNWRAFLTSSCRNYRLPFDEQLLIYAQRPDATAVLEMERWNRRFGRWVNRGSKGIAVFDRERSHRLRYYFDVADTHETRNSRPVPLWQVRPEYEQDVVETLENSFGELEHREDFGDALLSAARNAVEDNMGDYLGELEQLAPGSLLEELDDDNLTIQFRTVLGNSVAAMLLARCGIDPLDYLEDEDFQEIGNFNTPETRNALGVATRDIARMCLDEIARTVLSLERQAQKENRTLANLSTNLYAEAREPENPLERSQHHGSDLHQAGGLFDSQSAAAPGGADSPGQVRPDAETLFTGASENHLHQPADQRETEQASGGDPADRPAPDGGNRGADGENPGRDGGTESQQSHAVGGPDEQLAQRGGGNSADGADLQLNTPQDNGDIQRPSQKSQQMSLFDFGEVIPDKAYDLGYGHLGNGVTVWNRLEEEHGDYKTVAHIAPDRTVTFYDEEMPQAVREEIQRIADTSEMTISATQDAPVFSVSPREKEPQLNQDTFSIYQIPSTPEGRDFRFRSHEELESEGLAVDRNNYDLIYTAPLADGTTLEDIYYTFNADDRPTGFRGHSLSVSDVVVLNRDGEEEAYYCDNYGFTPVPEFLRGIPLETAETSMEPTPPQEEAGTGSGLEGAEAAPAEQIPEPRQRHGEQHPPDTEPYIYCEWSESPVFADKTRYSVGEFDALMRQADAERVAGSQAALEKYGGNWQAWYDADDPENAQYLGYDKVKFTVVMPDGTTYTERQDIGDGDGGVLDFLAKYPQYQDVLPTLREAAVRSQPALEEPVEETVPYNYEHEYLLLSRLKADCDYFLGAGGRAEKHLWAGNVSGQIAKMRELYDTLPEKPEWLTMEDIDRYESQMTAPVREEEAPAQKEEPLSPQLIPPHRDRITFTTPHPEIPNSERHNFRITDEHLGEGRAKTKFHNNVAAIRTLREIEFDNRLATPEEQEILSRYVGWGGLPQAFDGNNPQWAEEFTQLQKLLSPEEYEAAKATTLNAYYTSPAVIKAIYQAVENMGFRTGNILEPSCGIGNFFGLVPESMTESKLYGVELDPLTGRIAQQLYQQSSIAVQGVENTELPDSFFDLAIGNVPFGSYTLHDKRYDKHHFLIHDYFFAKTLDKVRPGGIVAFITSKGTLDKQNLSVRKYLAERAQLIGAIRLPNNAFLANAGTQVTTDILFLQKREKLMDVSMPEPDSGLEWLHLGQTEDGVPVNQYFLDHPEMLLGKMAFDRSMYGKEQIAFLILNTEDDVLICDPENEFGPLCQTLGREDATVIHMAAGGKDRLNAMYMVEGYGEQNPIVEKSQFVMSLIEQIDRRGVGPQHKSIIDRCTAFVYQDAEKTGKPATLCGLREKLLEQPEDKAKDIALSLELFTTGSLDIFGKESTVDLDKRIVVFDIHSLGEQLKPTGLLVITDTILNRVTLNWKRGKRTHVFIDEFHVVFENEQSGIFFSSAWRQFRKRGAYPTAITQNVEYLLDSVQASTMLSNSEFIVMLNQAASDREKLSKLLNISKEQMSYVTNADAGCGLLRYGSALVPFVNRFPKDTKLYALMTTKPGEGVFGGAHG